MRDLASFLTIIFGLVPATIASISALMGVPIGLVALLTGETDVLGTNSAVMFVTSLLGLTGLVGMCRVVENPPNFATSIMLCCGIAGGLWILAYFWWTGAEIWHDDSGFAYFILSAVIVALGHLLSRLFVDGTESMRK